MRIFLTLTLLLAFISCQTESQKKSADPLKYVELVTPTGEVIKTSIVYTIADQTQGLSGVKPEDFANDQGMLFFYVEDSEKNFWMPDTHFDLDLIYLDAEMKILDIIRKLPHYIGRANPHLIPRARGVWCRHTLEMKAGSEIAAKLKVGDKLKWQSSMSLEETTNKIKQLTLN